MSVESNPFGDHVVGDMEQGPFDLATAIRRVAAIDDEFKSRELDPLAKELEELKKTIKEHMLERKLKEAFDETSEWEAVFVPRHEDIWNIKTLKKVLTKTQRERCIEERVIVTRIKEGIASGDLSRAKLEQKGAVKRQQKGKPALYVRRRKEDDDAENDPFG